MATVERINLIQRREEIERSGSGAITSVRGVRAVLDDSGCGLDNCNCSPGYWISISDGETLLRVNLTEEEARELLTTSRIDTL